MIWLIILIPSLYFPARFFLLKRDINKTEKQFKEVTKNIEVNRRLTYFSGDKNIEKLLVTINKYLEKAQKEKIEYIDRETKLKSEIENISHDLRTPLTSILGYLELVKNENLDEEDRKEYVEIIERRAKGLHNLVDTFYDISRLEISEYNFKMEPLNIDKEIREQILLFYTDFEKKEIEVKAELLDREVYIMSDKNALERIFTNLFQNAIKYSKEEFKVRLKAEEDNVVIILENYTENLEGVDLEHLFDRFYMKDKARSTSSSGLGLTVTKLLVEKMGGEITVELEEEILRFTIKYRMSLD